MNRRNLSGIYIFYKFEDDECREPTCFEDCPEEKQDDFLNSLEVPELIDLSKQLAKTLRNIGEQFDLASGSSEKD